MGNPTGDYNNLSPILGSDVQKQYLQTVLGQVFNPGTGTIQGVTPYGGQLTPNLNQMMLGGVDASWNPSSPGQAQMQQQYGNIVGQQNQVNAANPLAMLQRYAGGAGASPVQPQTPMNPYTALMTPPGGNPGGYSYQTPTGASQGNGNGGPGGGLQSSTPVVFNNTSSTQPQAPAATPPVTPNVPYQSIQDPYLLPGRLGGVGGGSMSTAAWQQMMNGQSPSSSKPTSISSTARGPQPGMPQNPFVNYNPAFSAAAWGTGYNPSFL